MAIRYEPMIGTNYSVELVWRKERIASKTIKE